VYDTWDIVNGLGGLVGLFLGSSVLSVVETFLTFIFRLLPRFVKPESCTIENEIVQFKKIINKRYITQNLTRQLKCETLIKSCFKIYYTSICFSPPHCHQKTKQKYQTDVWLAETLLIFLFRFPPGACST
jgi:hypothetical protein